MTALKGVPLLDLLLINSIAVSTPFISAPVLLNLIDGRSRWPFRRLGERGAFNAFYTPSRRIQ